MLVFTCSVSESSSTIHIADGNDQFLSDPNVQKDIKNELSPHLLWHDVTWKGIKANFGAKADLCAAAAIFCGLAFKVQHKSNHLRSTLFIPGQLRRRILADLGCTNSSRHDERFAPTAKTYCNRCKRSFKSERALATHNR